MLDFWTTLQPSSGLTRAAVIQPPQGPTSPLWAVGADIGQRDRDGQVPSAAERAAGLVGAVGVTRRDALVRGAGEVVERFALLPQPGLANAGEDAAPFSPPHLLHAARARPAPRCYAGSTLATGAPVAVPCGLVDYPARAGDDVGTDPSPSGAASGASPEHALRSAARELLERDAGMCAWYLRMALARIDLPSVAARATGAELAKVLACADHAGLELHAATAPTAVAGVGAVLAVAVDPLRGIAAAGLSLHDTWEQSVARAVGESLQVWSFLVSFDDLPFDGTVSDDVARARYYRSRAGVAAIRDWVDGLLPHDDRVWADTPATAASLVPDGVCVSLTGRLPAAIRDQGWHAAKVISPSLAPLRMDETLPWTLPRHRLATARRAAGMSCGTSEAAPHSAPHPWI
jgi:ribosomal protein S12 methylthiotransferase accessory factor